MEIAILVVAIITLGVIIYFEWLRRKKRVYIETTKYKENDLWYIQVRVTDKKAVKPHFRRGPTLVCKTTRHAFPLNRPFDMDFDIEHENYERGFGQKEQGDYHVVYRFSVNEIKNAIAYGQTGHHEPTGIIRVETEDGVIETDEIPGEIFKLSLMGIYRI